MKSKDKIAQTAFELFLNNGYKASTMAQLVKNSQLSKGAFYHHFKSKQAVYDYVLEHYFLKYYQEINWQELEELDYKSFEKIIDSYYYQLIKEIKKLTNNNSSNYFIMFFEGYNNNANFKLAIKDFYTRLQELIIDKLVKDKTIGQNKAENMAIKLIAQYEGLLFYQAVFPEKTISEE